METGNSEEALQDLCLGFRRVCRRHSEYGLLAVLTEQKMDPRSGQSSEYGQENLGLDLLRSIDVRLEVSPVFPRRCFSFQGIKTHTMVASPSVTKVSYFPCRMATLRDISVSPQITPSEAL